MARRPDKQNQAPKGLRRRKEAAPQLLELLPPTKPATAWQRWAPIVLVAALVFVAYLPGIDNGFVSWDDDHYIFDNRQVSEPDGIKSIWGDVFWYSEPRFQRSAEKRVSHQYYPLVFTLYWLEFRLFGGDDTTIVEKAVPVDGKSVKVKRAMTIEENIKAGNMSASGFHVTSMVLHAVNVMLLIFCFRALGFSNWVAWAATILFAIHPLQVATVAWAAERKNIISLMFYLLSMMSYIKMRRCAPGSIGRSVLLYLLALVLFQAALFSKTVSLTLPIMLFFTDRLLERQSRPPIVFLSSMSFVLILLTLIFVLPTRPSEAGFDPQTAGFVVVVGVVIGLLALLSLLSWPPRLLGRSILRILPFIVLAGIAAWVTINVEDRQRTIPITDDQRPLVAGAIAWFYALKMLVPIGLAPVYRLWKPDNAELLWYLPLLGTIAAGLVVITLRKKLGAHFRWAVLFYAVTILPMSGFKNINYFQFAFVAEHYFYHVAVGLFLILALAVEWLGRRVSPPPRGQRLASGLICVAALAYGIRTFTYCNVWQTADTFWQRTLKINEECWPAYYNTGNARRRDAKKETDPAKRDALYEEAVGHYIRVTEINPRITQPFDQWILTRMIQKKYPEALKAAEEAARRFPHLIKYHDRAAELAKKIGRREVSVKHYRIAAKNLETLGDRYVRKGKHCSAAKNYRQSHVYWKDAYAQDRDSEQLREALKRVKRKYDQSKQRCDAKG